MLFRTTLSGIVLSLSLLAGQSHEHVSLNELIGMVREQNPEVKIADFEQQIKELDVKIAQGHRYGQLDFSETFSKTNHPGHIFGMKLASREATFNDFGFDEFLSWMNTGMQGSVLDTQPENLNHPDARDNYETKFTYRLPLYTGDRLVQYKKIAQEMLQIAKSDKGAILRTKISETKKTFYDIALLNSFSHKLNTILENITKLENTVNEMHKEGYAKKIDILEVQSTKADISRLLNQTESNRILALEFLSFLSDSEVHSINAEFDSAPMPDVSEEVVLQNNPDLQKIRSAVQISESFESIAGADYYPQIGVFAEEGWNDNRFGNFNDKDYYMVGAGLTYNLFHGGVHKNNTQKARVQLLQMQQKETLAKNGILLQLSKIQTGIKSLEYDIESLKTQVDFKNEIYQNYLGRYKENLVSINDVLIKQSEYIQSTLKLQEKQNTRNHRIFELEQLAHLEENP